MNEKIKLWLRQWNRNRLALRQLKKAQKKQTLIDLDARRAALGTNTNGTLPKIGIGVHIAHANSSQQSRCIQSIELACQQAQQLEGYLILQGTKHEAMMAQAFSDNCSAYLAIDARGALHPAVIEAMLKMHLAANQMALINATTFPEQTDTSFDSNHYITHQINPHCFLIPRGLQETLQTQRLPVFGDANSSIDWGVDIKTCPSALYFSVQHEEAIKRSDPDGKISIICRFHNPKRISELTRAVFSIACSSYQSKELIIVTQNFSSTDLEKTHTTIQPLITLANSLEIKMINFECEVGKDARTDLLNTGIANATGKYIAFLDHDDVIYPSAYTQLIHELNEANAAIAFGGVITKFFDCFDDIAQLQCTQPHNTHGSLAALFKMNCCPIHSYVLDRSKIQHSDLKFDNSLIRYEDYEFLLRICAKYPSSFKHYPKVIGDYYMKNDGSNSTPHLSSASKENQMLWLESKNKIIKIKEIIKITNPDITQNSGRNASIADYLKNPKIFS